MTLQDEIDALLAEAAPLRLLPDDESEAKGLPALVDRINALRAKQAREPFVDAKATIEGEEAKTAYQAAEDRMWPRTAGELLAGKRGPGRPKKAD
jgi:hypothetical protein